MTKKITFQRNIFLQQVALFKKIYSFFRKKTQGEQKSKIFCMLKQERRNLEGFFTSKHLANSIYR